MIRKYPLLVICALSALLFSPILSGASKISSPTKSPSNASLSAAVQSRQSSQVDVNVASVQQMETELKVVEAKADDFHSMLEMQTTVYSVIVAIALAALGFLTYVNLRGEFKLQLRDANQTLAEELKLREAELARKLLKQSEALEAKFDLQTSIVYRALSYATRDIPSVSYIWALRSAELRQKSGIPESNGQTIETFIGHRLDESLMSIKKVLSHVSPDRCEEALQILAKFGQYKECEGFIKELHAEIARVIALRPKDA